MSVKNIFMNSESLLLEIYIRGGKKCWDMTSFQVAMSSRMNPGGQTITGVKIRVIGIEEVKEPKS